MAKILKKKKLNSKFDNSFTWLDLYFIQAALTMGKFATNFGSLSFIVGFVNIVDHLASL